MDPANLAPLRRLFDEQRVAALATLHRGEPAVSMAPFALPSGESSLLVHVSALATHTRDMLAHPRVELLIIAAPSDQVPVQALPRVSLQADAERLDPTSHECRAGRVHYLARFPDAAMMFELPDFSLFALRPVSARLIAGFGQARTLVAGGLDAWLRAPGQ
jgi:putative heme iron utilization protein